MMMGAMMVVRREWKGRAEEQASALPDRSS